MSLKICYLDLSARDFVLLVALQDGANVFDRVDAQHLRSLDKRLPGIIKICAPRGPSRKAAIFGMRCTVKGKALLAEYAEQAQKIIDAQAA